MTSFFDQMRMFFWNIFNRPQLNDIIDILIVAVLLYHLIMLTRETRASDVMKGFVLLIVACLLSGVMGLTALTSTLISRFSSSSACISAIFSADSVAPFAQA